MTILFKMDSTTELRISSRKTRYKNNEGKIIENAPKNFRHILGTDNIGRDLAAGLIHGTRISLMVGLVAMGIASIIGIILEH